MIMYQKSIKRVVALIACAAITVGALSACNTVAGAGKDIKSTGKAIEKSGEENK